MPDINKCRNDLYPWIPPVLLYKCEVRKGLNYIGLLLWCEPIRIYHCFGNKLSKMRNIYISISGSCALYISSLLLSIMNKLKERYISYWNNRINSNNGMDKLRTYKLFKKIFGLEEYLEFGLDRKYRQCLSSFRISAHKLQIERGRYLGKNVEEKMHRL